MEKQVKPQLHISMLSTMSTCGVQFQRRYGFRFGCWHQEEIIPPGIALATGLSVHKAVEKDLNNKMTTENHLLLPNTHIEDIARDSFQEILEAGMMFNNDESINIKKTVGVAIDQTVALAMLHHNEIAPIINPIAIEEAFVIELEGYPFDIAGKKDVREVDVIRDTKTKAVSPPEHAARSMQMAMYALSEKIIRGKLPKKVCLDFLVKNKKVKAVTREAVPDDTWMKPLMNRIERGIEIIQSVKEGNAAFTPADPESWMCSEKWCGFANTCPFWGGK